MKKKQGVFIVIVAPSGAGKSTLINRLKKDFPQLVPSLSFTTRGIRPGEKHGVDYFFMKDHEFRQKIDRDDFLEWAQVHSHYYGTSKSFIKEQLAQGHFVLKDIDVQGADAIKSLLGDQAKIIFIEAPGADILRKRLEGRKTDSKEVIEERLKNAEKEMRKRHAFDYNLINDEVDLAYGKLKSIVGHIIKH